MKKLFFCLIILVMTGCSKNYQEDDIASYVKNELNLNNIKISKTYKESIDKDGYTDKIWTIIDNENNITFHVLDDFYYGKESTLNRLFNDYDESVFLKLYNTMDLKKNVVLNHEVVDSLNKVDLVCNFTSKKELKECYDSLLYYKNYIKSQNYNLAINYNIKYNYPLKKLGSYESNLGDTNGQLNTLDLDIYDKAMYNYLSTALIFQINSGVLEITKDDMQKIFENEETHLIFLKNDDGKKEQYSDIIAHTYSYGISFGTLYRILEKEGFNPNGTPWHYTVSNKEGDKFEFSYDFNDYVYDNGLSGYYYKKNSKKINMSYYFHNCFKEKEIKDMFGIDVYEIQKKFIIKTN